MPAPVLGLLTGLVAGLALAFGSFGDFLVVLFIGALGYLIGRVVEGSLDLGQYVNSARRQR